MIEDLCFFKRTLGKGIDKSLESWIGLLDALKEKMGNVPSQNFALLKRFA
jgi:hypothetical protein